MTGERARLRGRVRGEEESEESETESPPTSAGRGRVRSRFSGNTPRTVVATGSRLRSVGMEIGF